MERLRDLGLGFPGGRLLGRAGPKHETRPVGVEFERHGRASSARCVSKCVPIGAGSRCMRAHALQRQIGRPGGPRGAPRRCRHRVRGAFGRGRCRRRGLRAGVREERIRRMPCGYFGQNQP
eukprot:scaffold1671_cov344-Pavlova_lutheri.AAC.12